MSDYLFNRDGPPDPEVERLEHLLEGYRYRGRPAPPRRRRRAVIVSTVLVGAVAASVAAWLALRRPGADRWTVESLAGSPSCGGRPCAGLGPDDALETDPGSRARVQIGRFGHLDVEPGTSIRRRATVGQERLALLHGTVSAEVAAPPRLVVIETASARAVDLGCAYTLSVDAAGTGRLRVTSGFVALEAPSGSVFVPRGAEAALRGGSAPGTPVFMDAADELRDALALVDAGLAAGTVDRPALERVLAGARLRDTLSLFNLVPQLPAHTRAAVLDRMLALGAPVPHDLSRTDLLAADPDALERWRHTLSAIWL
jgi:ferric-dicitrate binding protein FerR (iron transport regulator)